MRFLRLVPLAAVLFLLPSAVSAQGASPASARTSRTAPAPSAIAPASPALMPARSLAPVLSESFDDVAALPGAGWSFQNLSSPVGVVPNWFQGSSATNDGGPFDAYSGSPAAYVGANFNSVSGNNTISNWMITPEVPLTNGTELTFYTRTVQVPSFPDRLEVRVSANGASTNVGTTNTSVGDFTTLLLTVNPTLTTSGYPNTWTLYTVTVSGLEGPTTGRFAFRYFVTSGGPSGANSDYIGIDEVSVEAPGFVFEQPALAQVYRVGNWLKAIWDWTSPDPEPANVVLSLRKGDGPYQVLYSGPNLERPDFGAARYRIPEGTPSGTDYNLRIEDAADPDVFVVSGHFTIVEPGASYTFVSPAPGGRIAAGSSGTVAWTAPAGAEGEDVQLALYNKTTGAPVGGVNVPGSPSSVEIGFEGIPVGRYYFTLEGLGSLGFTGRSAGFSIVPLVVTAPTAGATATPGATLNVTWSAPTLSGGTARIVLRSASQGRTVLVESTENDGEFVAELPAGQAESSDYYVLVQVTSGDQYNATSGVFSVGPAEAVPPTAHFVPAPLMGADLAALRVQAPALADGAEVGVFLGERLLGAAVVAGGTADVTVRGSILVPALVVDGLPAPEDFVYVPDGAVLTLRAFDGLSEQVLETTAPVTFANGSETTVTAKGAAADASPSALRVSAFPNPASSAATVHFETVAEGAVSVEVFDVLGRRVATLAEGTLPAGTHTATWDASAAGAGAYVVRVVAAGAQATVRLSVAR